MNFNKKKFKKEGFFVQKKIISKKDVKMFFDEIEELIKIYHKKNFYDLYKNNSDRTQIYKKLQNLKSVRHIVHKVCLKFDKHKVYEKLNFKVPVITNGLIVSIPQEEKNLNPLHQDIYNFTSFNFLKIWLPLTKVDKARGSMMVYKCSNKLGFIKPKYKSKKSTYPEIEKKFTIGFKELVFDLDPGDCVIFDPLILHKSVKNNSEKTRFNIGIDIQDFFINGKQSVINKMQKIRDERTRRRTKLIKV